MHNYMNGNRDSSSSTHNPPPRPSPPQTSQTQQHQQHQTHQQQQQQHHQQQQHRQNGYTFQHTSIFITIKNWFDFCLHWYWKYQLFGDWLTSVYSKWDLSFLTLSMLFGIFLTINIYNIDKDSTLRKWWNVKCCKMSKIISFIVYFQPGITKPPSPVFYRGWVWKNYFHGRRGYNEKLTKNFCWNIWRHVAHTYCSSIIVEQDWPRASMSIGSFRITVTS